MRMVRWVPATAVFTTWVVVVFLIDPALEGAWYYILAPWSHDGWTHLDQNLAMLVVLGGVVEWIVGRMSFAKVSIVSAYLTLFGAVFLGIGGWSEGISGVTNVYVGFIGMVLAFEFIRRFTDASSVIDWILVLGCFVGLLLSIAKVMVTGARFVGWESAPAEVAVGVHALGLLVGVLWFATRQLAGWSLLSRLAMGMTFRG